jgi:iron complex outermembrane receptor protein
LIPHAATAVSCLAISLAVQGTAFAQESTPKDDSASDDIEEIQVVGIRRAIQESLAIKRNELAMVEVVSAEEIGKLPDSSIGESIARLPGLAAQRVNGRAQTISIRGLAPDFSTTLLNGRQQASSGDNRAVEFDQYPSELLSGVVVYKTPDADVAGMGLSGTTDLRTVRPLEYGKRAIAINLRGEMNSGEQLNDDVGRFGGRASISYFDQNDSETIGWAFGYAHLDSPSKNLHTKNYGYETFGDPFVAGRILPDAADSATFLTGQEIFAYSRTNKRDALIGVLEFKPSDKLRSTVDLYYSTFDQEEIMRGAQWFSNVWADDQTYTGVSTDDVGGTQVALTGTGNGIAPILRNDWNTREDKLMSIGLNTEYQFNDNWALDSDFSYSNNQRDESITETYAGFGSGSDAANQNANRVFDSIAWDLNASGFQDWSNGLNYADSASVSLGDRAPWGGWGHDGQTKDPHVEETVYSADVGFKRSMEGFLSQVSFGANFTHRDKDKRVDEFDLMLKNNRAQALVDPRYLVDSTSLDFAGFGSVLSVNLPAAIGQYYDRITFINGDTYNKAWALDEDVLTWRAKALFAHGKWRGNFGVQVVQQKQESDGSRINETVTPREVIPVTAGAEYTDVLPSVNGSYNFTDNQRLRFAAAKVMARPRIDDMRASFTPGFGNPCGGSPPCVPGQTVNPWSADGGNPNLEPWRATAFDLSYEWYIGSASYFSVAGFYKDLDTYIFTQRELFDFSGLPLPPTSANIPAGVIISPIGQISHPANGKGGSLKGVEISGALELGKLWRPLDGFGAIASFSRTLSDLHPLAANEAGDNGDEIRSTRIPGLSGKVYNLTGYFEKFGFQARASYRYRSAFKGEVTQLFAVRGVTEILADKQLDAQVGYTFQEGTRLSGLSLLLQVNNLTNSPYRTRLGVDGGGVRTEDGSFLPETYEEYGRDVLLGFSYHY